MNDPPPSSTGRDDSGSTPPPPPPYGSRPPAYPPSGGHPAYGATPAGNQKALWALILGIVGLLCCAVLSVVAIVLGSQAKKEIRASGGLQAGDGQAQAGIVLGIIGCALWGAGVAFYAILVVLGSTVGS
jgi:hypothetical protein